MTSGAVFRLAAEYAGYFEAFYQISGGSDGPIKEKSIREIRECGQIVSRVAAALAAPEGSIMLDSEMVLAGQSITGTMTRLLRGPVGPLLVELGVDRRRADVAHETFRRMRHLLAAPVTEAAHHA